MRRPDYIVRVGAVVDDDDAAMLGNELMASLGLGNDVLVVEDDGDPESILGKIAGGIIQKAKAKKALGNKKSSTLKTWNMLLAALMAVLDGLAQCDGPMSPDQAGRWNDRIIQLLRGLTAVAKSGVLGIFSSTLPFETQFQRAVKNAVAQLAERVEANKLGGTPCPPLAIKLNLKAWGIKEEKPSLKEVNYLLSPDWTPEQPPKPSSGSARDWNKYFLSSVPPMAGFTTAAAGAAAAAAGSPTTSSSSGTGTTWTPTLPGDDDDDETESYRAGTAGTLGPVVGLGLLGALVVWLMGKRRA